MCNMARYSNHYPQPRTTQQHHHKGGHTPPSKPHSPSQVKPVKSAGGDHTGHPLLDAINKARIAENLRPLTLSDKLTEAARDNDSINNSTGSLGHHIDLGKYGSQGEITVGGSGPMNAELAVRLWLNSPGHKAILLNPSYNKIGVSISGNFATADFSV